MKLVENVKDLSQISGGVIKEEKKYVPPISGILAMPLPYFSDIPTPPDTNPPVF
ncbi:hypothetical protein [Glaciecola sp. 1036]|uniref:hypothetical protein n=1 Tax=Alteromonadaceae TaxID=72275 RepID=UPI003CFF522E